MSKLCVIGTGYVGLVTGTCFADLGNTVTCLDVDETRISKLKKNIMPIYEPGLEQVVRQNVQAGRLIFTTNYRRSARRRRIRLYRRRHAFRRGRRSRPAVRALRRRVDRRPGRSPDRGRQQIHRAGRHRRLGGRSYPQTPQRQTAGFHVVSNPEFLREGSAINDFMSPDRVVLGSDDRSGRQPCGRALRNPALPDPDHRSAHRRNDQIRLQRLPGHPDLLHQRDRQYL